MTLFQALDDIEYRCGEVTGDIPIEARIVAFADVFDALTSNQLYKESSPEQ